MRSDFPSLPGGFGRAEYALLDPVADTDWQVYLLNLGNVDMSMNAHDHGLSREQLTERLFELWRNGWIECMSDGRRVDPSVSVLEEQFEREGDWPLDSKPLFYRLGTIGGEVWESLTVLDWAKYVSRTLEYRPGGQKWQTRASSDLDLLKLAFAADQLWGAPMPGMRVLTGTERWSETQPWRATYWKTLPVVGYRVEFSWEDEEGRHQSDEEWVLWEKIRRELPERMHWRKSFEEVCAEHFKDAEEA